MALHAQEKQIRIETSVERPSEPLSFDAGKIERVLINLLENSCKFTPRQGTIHVSAYSVSLGRSGSQTCKRGEGRSAMALLSPTPIESTCATPDAVFPASTPNRYSRNSQVIRAARTDREGGWVWRSAGWPSMRIADGSGRNPMAREPNSPLFFRIRTRPEGIVCGKHDAAAGAGFRSQPA